MTGVGDSNQSTDMLSSGGTNNPDPLLLHPRASNPDASPSAHVDCMYGGRSDVGLGKTPWRLSTHYSTHNTNFMITRPLSCTAIVKVVLSTGLCQSLLAGNGGSTGPRDHRVVNVETAIVNVS